MIYDSKFDSHQLLEKSFATRLAGGRGVYLGSFVVAAKLCRLVDHRRRDLA
jgi:hypothetical protein